MRLSLGRTGGWTHEIWSFLHPLMSLTKSHVSQGEKEFPLKQVSTSFSQTQARTKDMIVCHLRRITQVWRLIPSSTCSSQGSPSLAMTLIFSDIFVTNDLQISVLQIQRPF
jgi:hypothetical protein